MTPCSTIVLAELVALRKYRGISILKVKNKAPNIQMLQAVDMYLQSKGLDESHRHIATYDVLSCTINQKVLRSDLHRILKVTLNFEGIGRNKLTDRQEDLKIELRTKSSRAYAELESEAFQQLTGQLILLTESPCSEESPHQAPRNIRVEMSLILNEADLLSLLRAFTIEDREAILTHIEARILELLPAGEAAAKEILGPTTIPSYHVVALVRGGIQFLISSVAGKRFEDLLGILEFELLEQMIDPEFRPFRSQSGHPYLRITNRLIDLRRGIIWTKDARLEAIGPEFLESVVEAVDLIESGGSGHDWRYWIQRGQSSRITTR